MDGVIHDLQPLALAVVAEAAVEVSAAVVATVDQDLLFRGGSAVWIGMIGDQGALATAPSQSIVHLHQRGGSAAFLLMVAEAQQRDQAHRQRSARKLNATDQITVGAQRGTIAGAL